MSQTIQLNGRSVRVHHFTGKVANASKHLETRVHGSGGGGYTSQGSGTINPVTITSTTVVHDQIFIVDRDGRERALQLTGWNVPVREGNTVTAMWAIVDGEREGPYFAIINHSTGDRGLNDDVVKELARRCSGPFHIRINNPVVGCLVLVALLALLAALFLLWWPLGVALIGYFVYFELILLKGNIRKFNASVEYPVVQPW
jgi:hypothetical protein